MVRYRLMQSFLVLLALTMVLVACAPAATPTPAPTPTPVPTATPSAAETETWLHAELGPGEAVVWYLGHCGYAIRTQNHLLIFDYQETYDGQSRKRKPAAPGLQNGFVAPQQIAHLPVRVLVTHSHEDHFNSLIFNWKAEIPDIAYYFGWQEGSDPTYHSLVGPRARLSADGMEIYTINSHHDTVPEVAYLVKVDGLVIYHNGDYLGDFKADYPFLREVTDHIDLTFVLRGYEDGNAYSNQNLDLFQRFRQGAIFPTHDKAGGSGYAAFERAFLSRLPGLPIFVPRRMGELFLYRDGQVTRE